MKTKMTLEQHLENADDLAMARHYLWKVFDRCQKHYPRSSRVMRALHKITPGFLTNAFEDLKCALDGDYHALITDAQFKELGHIYYNLEDRYQKLTSEAVK